MTIQLYSIDHAPAGLPIWETILDDLGRPPAHRVAKLLGVGLSTVYRYNQLGRAPRACQLALFWLTRWGRSSVHAQATNDAIVACGYVESLRRQVHELQLDLGRVLALSNSGAANDPLLRGPHV